MDAMRIVRRHEPDARLVVAGRGPMLEDVLRERGGVERVAAVAARPDGIAVPKVSSADQVRRIAADLDAAGADPQLAIWAMIETPQAVLDAREIAQASERLAVLVMGTNDLVKELHSRHVPGRAPLTTALQLCVLAARAADVIILDGVYNDVRDAEGFAAQVNEAVLMGFDGKTLIHPGQVEVCNSTFAPSEEAVEEAKGVLQAWEDGAGKGVVTHNGKMIENRPLYVALAQRKDVRHQQLAAQMMQQNQLRMQHANGHVWDGIDIASEGVSNNMDQFVWEPALIKINALSSSAEAARLILSIDETIRAQPNEPAGGGPPMPPGTAQRALRSGGRGLPRR